MQLLLDENLPKRLKLDFSEHEFFTVIDKCWNRKKNGELLKLLCDGGFDALFTFHRNLRYQQNFSKYPVAELVLHARDNTYATLKKLIPPIKNVLNEELSSGVHVVKE